MAQQNSTTKPVHEIRLGRVRAAIWENETQHGIRHNVTVSRLYKDGDNWKDSSSFGRDDLPVVGNPMRPNGSGAASSGIPRGAERV